MFTKFSETVEELKKGAARCRDASITAAAQPGHVGRRCLQPRARPCRGASGRNVQRKSDGVGPGISSAPLLGPLGKAVAGAVARHLHAASTRRFAQPAHPAHRPGSHQRDDARHGRRGPRVSRYLLMQLVVNVTYGIPVAIGLYFIGVPNAVLWGAFATVLRFIPYIGPWIAADSRSPSPWPSRRAGRCRC